MPDHPIRSLLVTVLLFAASGVVLAASAWLGERPAVRSEKLDARSGSLKATPIRSTPFLIRR